MESNVWQTKKVEDGGDVASVAGKERKRGRKRGSKRGSEKNVARASVSREKHEREIINVGLLNKSR